jgi:NTP pyrophosphatase (non-canonical NTP hydrolase)
MDPANIDSLASLRDRLRTFAAARDWDQFHSPKNLTIALSVETAELLEHFQWISDEDSRVLPADKLRHVKDELADVLIYLVRLADKLDVDLAEAASDKIQRNEQRYPAALVRGSSRKYTEY